MLWVTFWKTHPLLKNVKLHFLKFITSVRNLENCYSASLKFDKTKKKKRKKQKALFGYLKIMDGLSSKNMT